MQTGVVMSWNRTLGISGVLLLLAAGPAEALRCGSKVVSLGDTQYQVRQRCGEPDDVTRRWVTVYQRVSPDREVAVDVEVVEWLYDFGRNRLVTRLRFVDGVLEHEWTDGYGTR
jgi:hypothetical protein